MAKRLTVDFSADAAQTPTKFRAKMSVTDMQNVDINQLSVNPHNAEFFLRESDAYFERLTEDIRKRGILVPLLAKKDGTLLAGHNRLAVAQAIGLKYVPVQYVTEELSAEAEQEFIIKDNLLRRQFSQEEWATIYRKLVPDFEEILMRDGRGKHRGKGISQANLEQNTQEANVFFNAKTATTKDMVTFLAKETGEKTATVEKRIQRAKSKQQKDGSVRKNAEIAPSDSRKDNVLSSISALKKECKTLVNNCNDKKLLVKVQKILMQ
jgi:ParB-like chromosome segregation protein Spo0J